MRLYHVGYQTIEKPDIYFGRKNADFGQGFYMTIDKDFAFRWAKERNNQDIIVNMYDLNIEGLEMHTFIRDNSWYDYIYGNRNGQTDYMTQDVICGPIANDIIYDTLGITTSGFLSKEMAMRLFMIGPEYKQVVIKTIKAAEHLRWISSNKIDKEELREYKKIMTKEEAEFQKLFAEEMERISNS